MRYYGGKIFTITITVFFLTALPATIYAQIFKRDVAYLNDKILPIAKEKNHQNLVFFIEVLLPQLDSIINKNPYNLISGLKGITANKITQKDIILFAFDKARIKKNLPFTFPPLEIMDEILFELELLCPIREFLNLKPERYQSKMPYVTKMLVNNYYSGELRWLALLPEFYEINAEKIRSDKKFPDINSLVIVELLNFAIEKE